MRRMFTEWMFGDAVRGMNWDLRYGGFLHVLSRSFNNAFLVTGNVSETFRGFADAITTLQ